MSSIAIARQASARRVHADSSAFMAQPLGKIGIFWFLASEIMVFGGLIGSYILCRLAAGGWGPERAHVNTRLAVINTIVLVTSSLTIVEAHARAEANQRSQARRFLLATVLLGCTFLCIKGYEYSHELAHGFTPSAGLFWSFYYMMTGLHGVHVLVGVIINFALFAAAGGRAWPTIKHRIEYAGLYWHFVDVVWIFLFPLLYLA